MKKQHGLEYSPDMNHVNISLERWTTPSKYAKELGISNQRLNGMIALGKIRKVYIKELDLTLVEKDFIITERIRNEHLRKVRVLETIKA
jgi:hypothetical protein